jgi:hypothetical protein
MSNEDAGYTSIGQRRFTRRQLLKSLCAGTIALSTGSLYGCPRAKPDVVVVGAVSKVFPNDRPTGTSGANLLVATRNKFQSFQIVIKAGESDLRNVNVALSAPLSGPGGTIPADNITIYREDYYRVDVNSDEDGSPGLWPDALIPAKDPWYGEQRNAFPIDVPAKENRVAWMDVLVPERASPGKYSRSIKVTAQDFDDANVPVQLTVIDATLPRHRASPALSF